MNYGKSHEQVIDFYKEAMRRIEALPGVSKTAFGDVVPWRDGNSIFAIQFSGDGHTHSPGVEDPRAQGSSISPGYFAALGVPILAGRDFNDLDGKSQEPVVIVSETLAQRMFPNQDPINRHVYWTDPVLQFLPGSKEEKARFMAPRRIIGVTADIDDQHVIPQPTMTIYSPFEEGPLFGGRLFIHTRGNPYEVVAPATSIIHSLSADQPVERPATLKDARAEVLTPDRLNSLVFGAFALVALIIAVVGVAGVLAFSVSSRRREFGIRLALGSQPQSLLRGVLNEGVVMAGLGIVAGAIFGFALLRVAGSYLADLKSPGAVPVTVSALLLLTVAVVASMLPAVRAARVDVIQALRSE
jgi:ABC-type antimicrobial peptide transport system permease subunit